MAIERISDKVPLKQKHAYFCRTPKFRKGENTLSRYLSEHPRLSNNDGYDVAQSADLYRRVPSEPNRQGSDVGTYGHEHRQSRACCFVTEY
jgi:hypothetical protein